MIYGASSCMATNLFFYYLDEELLCIYVDDHEKLIRCIHILYSSEDVKMYQPIISIFTNVVNKLRKIILLTNV